MTIRDLAPLKVEARKNRPRDDPYRVAVETLPDTLSEEEFVGVLHILIPLARSEKE